MNLQEAQRQAQLLANQTGTSAIVFKSDHNLTIAEENRYGAGFTLPPFGTRIGERVYPDNLGRILDILEG